MNIKSMFTDTLYIRMFFIQLLSLVSIMAQQPSRTLSAVDAELACICGENSSPYAERIRLIHSLPSNLAPGQLERCRAFLEELTGEQGQGEEGGWVGGAVDRSAGCGAHSEDRR